MSTSVNPCCWFEIPVSNMDEGIAFYSHVFEMKIDLQHMDFGPMAFFPMSEEDMGAGGALVCNDCMKPGGDGVLIYLSVTDIEAALARATDKGAKPIMPKTAIGEHGFIAIFHDPDGNKIGMHCMS